MSGLLTTPVAVGVRPLVRGVGPPHRVATAGGRPAVADLPPR